MEKPSLNDPDEFPDEEVLSRALGRVKAAWDALMGHLDADHPTFAREWRYYNDGKSWLHKVTKQKKTICWVAVFPRSFKTTFYFPERAEDVITASRLDQVYVDQFLHGRQYGTTRGITVEIKKKADLKATKTLIEMKEAFK